MSQAKLRRRVLVCEPSTIEFHFVDDSSPFDCVYNVNDEVEHGLLWSLHNLCIDYARLCHWM